MADRTEETRVNVGDYQISYLKLAQSLLTLGVSKLIIFVCSSSYFSMDSQFV